MLKVDTSSARDQGSSLSPQHSHRIPEAGISPQILTWTRLWGDILTEAGVRYETNHGYSGFGCWRWELLTDDSPVPCQQG